MEGAESVARVERGGASAEELAAIVALLSALARRERQSVHAERTAARWRRGRRAVFQAPHSWRA
ncbi:hypothetical protein BIV23_09985 [Streptomyces monashensis]|uniref:Acyl-CoA carboxylase subunit epsilon n=1 Tax=Streptomyces monashensis TaxID=1678012 RepID=A0A1S2QIY1_9ACTN|nr:hypothetical protein BIV23_09985 [Streptomyces monashensis]